MHGVVMSVTLIVPGTLLIQ